MITRDPLATRANPIVAPTIETYYVLQTLLPTEVPNEFAVSLAPIANAKMNAMTAPIPTRTGAIIFEFVLKTKQF
ncbi:hypothetical protein GCK72_013939 [Caenorhabditis remanei]|uniref:Uncharacterized protein n=1 Tax=Caenorhabditis remanei TaxID=31234 RepID=A0A6A5GSH4_CAERE|nr:hypothetical protein GCK72_013939 [Caenorhabditis remanei]KAF1757483.1 hypothetical protein GCK72_013939 [Caenorhabditis remanei]